MTPIALPGFVKDFMVMDQLNFFLAYEPVSEDGIVVFGRDAIRRMLVDTLAVGREGPEVSMQELTVFHVYDHLLEPAERLQIEAASKALLDAGEVVVVKPPKEKKEKKGSKSSSSKSGARVPEEDKSLARLFV